MAFGVKRLEKLVCGEKEHEGLMMAVPNHATEIIIIIIMIIIIICLIICDGRSGPFIADQFPPHNLVEIKKGFSFFCSLFWAIRIGVTYLSPIQTRTDLLKLERSPWLQKPGL